MSVSPVCIDWDAIGTPRDVLVGPIRVRVNARFAPGQAPPDASRWALVTMLAHHGPLFFGWLIRGDARCSPFFDPRTRAPLRLPIPPGSGP